QSGPVETPSTNLRRVSEEYQTAVGFQRARQKLDAGDDLRSTHPVPVPIRPEAGAMPQGRSSHRPDRQRSGNMRTRCKNADASGRAETRSPQKSFRNGCAPNAGSILGLPPAWADVQEWRIRWEEFAREIACRR